MIFFTHFIRVFFWWYSYGMWAFLSYIQRQIHFLFYGLSLRVLFMNLSSPLYGRTSRVEHYIGILVRVGHFAIFGTFGLIGALTFLGIFGIFMTFPFLPLILELSWKGYLLAYLCMLLVYFVWKESTKPTLHSQTKGRTPKNFTAFAESRVKDIFSSSQKFEEQVKRLFLTKDVKEFFMRLEVFHIPMEKLSLNMSKEKLFEEAFEKALGRNASHIEILDILYALWKVQGNSHIFWKQIDADDEEIEFTFSYFEKRKHLKKMQGHWASYAAFQKTDGIDKGLTSPFPKKLTEFSHNITIMRTPSTIVPLVGRDNEYKHIIEVLRSNGGAVLLVGRSGVGKSRIVEQLTEDIIIDNVPRSMYDSRLIELDIGRILSGDSANAADQGGKNLISALDEVKKSRHIILTIDNLITLAGENFSTIFFIGILAKYIENKSIRLIATTTQEDYNRFLSKYPTYLRHFTKIELPSLSSVNTQEVLAFHAMNLEKKHKTIVSSKCFKTIIDISEKHFGDIENPEKSLRLLRESITRNASAACISSEHIKSTLASLTGINITALTEDEKGSLSSLETEIHKSLIGQDIAVASVADALRRARLDLHDYEGPIAKFLFVGPTGVGKTELAKTVARIHFGAESKMLRLDMSEFQDVSGIKRFIGDEHTPGMLTEPIRNTPHMLILFDELEKAHPDILNLFLQLLDDGRITDGIGRTVDFRNTIIIATSNAGAKYIMEDLKAQVPFTETAKTIKSKILFDYFRPEFLNRFTNIVVFEPLKKDVMMKVTEKLLRNVQKLFERKHILVQFTADAVKRIVEDGFTVEMGARPIKNLIIERLESSIAKGLLTSEYDKQSVLLFDGVRVYKK